MQKRKFILFYQHSQQGSGNMKGLLYSWKALLNANEWITYNSLLPAGVISYDISQNCLFCKEQPSALFETEVTRLKGADYRMSNRRKSRTRTLISYKKMGPAYSTVGSIKVSPFTKKFKLHMILLPENSLNLSSLLIFATSSYSAFPSMSPKSE